MRAGTGLVLGATSIGMMLLAHRILRDEPSRRVRWIVSGAAFAVPWLLHATVSKADCVLVFVSDTHGPARDNTALVQALLSEKNVDMVLHGGDISDTAGLWSAWWDRPFADVATRWPVYAASGNHDVESADGASEFTRRFGVLPRKVTCRNADVFLLPWSVTNEVGGWLQAQAAASVAKHRILVLHRPIWSASGSSSASLLARLRPSLGRIDLVLAGHDHVSWDSVHEVDGHRVRQIIEVSGPKKYECNADVVGCIGGSTGYLRIEVDDGITVTRRTI